MKNTVAALLSVIICFTVITSCSEPSPSAPVTSDSGIADVTGTVPSSTFEFYPHDKYWLCVHEYWYSVMNNGFDGGSTVPVDVLMSYFMMFELQLREPGTVNDAYLNPKYEEYAVDDKLIDFTIPVEIVDGYLERKFNVTVDGSESRYLSDDGTEYNVYNMACGQLYGELCDSAERDGIITLYCRGWGFAGDGMEVRARFELDIAETEDGDIRFLECRQYGQSGET